MFPDRVRRVIAETFGVIYADSSGVWRLLKAMGWSVQVPARRAVERNEGAIAAWIEQTWPQIEKKGADRGLDPVRGRGRCEADRGFARTWAPVGQTPVLHVVKGRPVKMPMAAMCCYRRDHVSRMLFRTRPGWYRDRDLVAFVDPPPGLGRAGDPGVGQPGHPPQPVDARGDPGPAMAGGGVPVFLRPGSATVSWLIPISNSEPNNQISENGAQDFGRTLLLHTPG